MAQEALSRVKMRLTVPHHHDFGDARRLVGDDLLNPEAWDNLRMESETMFVFHPEREEWDREIASNAYQERRARRIVEWLDEWGITSIASYGVGPAPVERWINRLRPDWKLKLTDYGPRTVKRLKTHFPEAEAFEHDFVHDPPLEAELQMFCCVDTELGDDEWRETFRNFAAVPVLMFPCITFGIRTMIDELRQHGPGKKPTRCGYWRTKGRFEELASHTHDPQRLNAGRAGTGWRCEPRE